MYSSESNNGELALSPSSQGYSSFREGNVTIWAQALINNQWTKKKEIAIVLRLPKQPAKQPDLAPVATMFNVPKELIAGQKLRLDVGIQNQGDAAGGNKVTVQDAHNNSYLTINNVDSVDGKTLTFELPATGGESSSLKPGVYYIQVGNAYGYGNFAEFQIIE